MAEVIDQIEALGAQVLVVSFSPPHRVQAYIERYPQPFPVASDPELKGYQSFSIGRASVKSFFRPRVFLHYLKLMFTGWLPGKPTKGDDILQLGGDFILDRTQRLVYAHPSGEASDRPAMRELLRILETASRAA